MFSPLDTRIAFFGGACSVAALEAVVRLVDAGYEMVAGPHDPREGVVLNDAGIPTMQNRIEACQGAQVIITSCAHPSEVEELYLGDNGLLEIADEGSFLVDLSVITPRLAQEIQAMAAVNGLTYLDAPIINVGEQEKAVCFVGGEPEGVELITPLLPYMAHTIRPLGSPGEGALSAVMVIIGLAGSLMGTIEAMALANICQFNTRSALDALASTSAASRALLDYVPQTLNYDFKGRLKVSEFLDMLDTALMASEDMDVTLGDELNIQAISLLYEDEQTCADYGLDWALAEDMRNEGGAYGYGGEYAQDQISDPRLRELFNSIQAQMAGTGAMGTGNPELDDYRNHHTRPDDEDGPDFPSAGEFFSKN